MTRRHRTSLVSFLLLPCAFAAALLAPLGEGVAHAEEGDLETADGADECRVFQATNDRDLARWEKEQPAAPYRYPRERLFMNAPWAQALDTLGRSGELLLATFIPHVGAQFRGGEPAAHVAWPWSLVVFGPKYACSRKKGTFVVHGHRAHRLLLEPAVYSSPKGIGLSVRPGYRFIWHPSTWVVGPGIGLGSTVEIASPREPFRASIGPEAVAHFGTCCRSSYFTFALRYDHFLAGTDKDIIGGSLGYTFF